MGKNRFNNITLLFFIATVLATVVIYRVSNFKDSQLFSLPNTIEKKWFNRNVMDKVAYGNDTDTILKVYGSDSTKPYYQINQNITGKDIDEYLLILNKIGKTAYLESREIDTFGKQITNKYLGFIFYFKYVGSVAWTIIYFLFIFVFLKKRHRRESWFVIFYLLYIYLITGLFISGNFRYSLTSLPITYFVIAIILNDLENTMLTSKQVKLIMSFMVILQVINFILYLNFFTSGAKQYYTFENVLKDKGSTIATPDKKLTKSESLYQIIDLLNKLQISDRSKVLEVEATFLYYYTDYPGVHYESREDYLISENFTGNLTINKTDEEILDILVNKLNCRYILSNTISPGLNPEFSRFLRNKTTRIFSSSGYDVYQINN